jgi:hypothetical protein
MIDARCCLVTGHGGARMDFIAGWLGCLPGFIDNNWSINPITGASKGDQQQIKNLDTDKHINLSNCLNDNLNINLSANSSICYAGSLHGWHLAQQIQDYNGVQILYIDISKADRDKISWEFFVKTYLCKKDRFTLYNTADKNPNLDLHVTNINKQASITLPRVDVEKTMFLDYTQLFVEDGSRYLTEILGIVVDDVLHDFYNSNLNYANSPNEINCQGRVWRRSDYF